MDQNQWLADRFEEHRSHLRAVAYRMLGSISEADDAVQGARVRLSRSRADEVENLGGWLTTVVARVCLNMLRARNVRREEPFDGHLPDPDLSRQREVVDAFFAAARRGDFDGLAALLHPNLVLRSEFAAKRPPAPPEIRGAEEVARQALMGAIPAARLHPALVNGTAGAVVTIYGRPFAVMGFTVTEGRIVEINAIADPERVGRIAVAILTAQ